MSIRIPAAAARREVRVEGSRFIAQVTLVADEDAARALRRSLIEEFPDATHHCWGLSLHTRLGERSLADDAGEPRGTAGGPILQAIRAAGVINVLVVVVRYFGGTKLGRGGLTRAYREAARAALEAAGAEDVVPVVRLRLAGPTAADGEVRHLIARHAGRVIDAAYGDAGGGSLVIELPEAAAERLRDDLGHLTRGTWAAIGRDDTDLGGG